MKARLVAEIPMAVGWVHGVWQLGDRLVVGARDAVWVVRGDRLEPLLSSIDVREMHDDHVRTPDEILRLDGASVPVPSFERGRVEGFLAIDGGFILGIHDDEHTDAAAVARLDERGGVVWHAPTPPPGTIGGYVSEMRADDGWVRRPKPAWEPREWILLSDDLHVSGDRLLAHFAEMPRSGIGVCYGLELATGARVYTTTPAPYQELGIALEPGEFLLGVQGYGAFETRLVDRAGTIRTTWPTHGIRLPGDPVRLLEMENSTAAKLHAVTLLPDGGVHRGARLPGYYTSDFVVAVDGGAVFWRDGAVVYLAPDGERALILHETPADDRAHVRALGGRVPGQIALAWSASSAQRLLLFDVD